ncbi:MAG: M48 family metallopeptidase [Syntrophobacterales bacterium]|nr:M48 family metallopeptidase [Syntrophobacterales bacterium]
MDYRLVKSARRKNTISLQVRSGGTVVVRAPLRTSKEEIESFLEEKKAWLRKTVLEQKERERDCREKTFKTGESFLYLGKSYPLRVIEGDGFDGNGPPLKFSGGRFTLKSGESAEGKTHFEVWYRQKAFDYILRRTRVFSLGLQCFPSFVRLSDARRRWGSCSSDNRLSINWRLIMAPPKVIDYVILHELLHIKEKSHSRRFWKLMETILPDYREHRYWLKENGHRLTV